MTDKIIKVNSARYRLLEDGFGERPSEDAIKLLTHLWRFYRSGINKFKVANLCNALDLDSPSEVTNLLRELVFSGCLQLI